MEGECMVSNSTTTLEEIFSQEYFLIYSRIALLTTRQPLMFYNSQIGQERGKGASSSRSKLSSSHSTAFLPPPLPTNPWPLKWCRTPTPVQRCLKLNLTHPGITSFASTLMLNVFLMQHWGTWRFCLISNGCRIYACELTFDMLPRS